MREETVSELRPPVANSGRPSGTSVVVEDSGLIEGEPAAKPDAIVLLHTMDPRGTKIGGIETHVRLVLARHPRSISILFVGIDEVGDLPLGTITPLMHEGRPIDFLPVMRLPPERVNVAATSIMKSTTLRFCLAMLRYLPSLRRVVRERAATVEIERYEFAIVAKLMRSPFVLLVHNEGSRQDKMDSLLRHYWMLHEFNERIALKLADSVLAVNAAIASRIEALSPTFVDKTTIMSVAIDIERFKPTPFEAGDAFHVCFAGRLDAFKDPPLMFAALARFNERLSNQSAGRFRRLVFDYVGASDPNRFEEFARIANVSVVHGIRRSAEVAPIMRKAHAGLITSFFEGMPCYLLEMIASGRPVVAIALPQFKSVIVDERSGVLVERHPDRESTADALADALMHVAESVDAGCLDPAAIAACAHPFSIEKQMSVLFNCHDALRRSLRSSH